jgi:hypothetical protein
MLDDNTVLDTATFKRNLDWVISVFQTQDLLVVNALRVGAASWLNRDFFRDVLIAAMRYLAVADPETFDWVLFYYDPKLHVELKQATITFLAETLIQQGFVPGEDFSCDAWGKLLMTPAAHESLLAFPQVWRSPLIDEVLCNTCDCAV